MLHVNTVKVKMHCYLFCIIDGRELEHQTGPELAQTSLLK